MGKAYTFVSRIPSHYTGDNCAQVMMGYKKYMTLFNKDGVQYHYAPSGPINVNKYLSDNRRFEFPYYDIPVHVENRLNGKYNFTNQLFEYEEAYVTISDNSIIECMAILDKDEALLINNILPVKKRIINVDRDELDRLFKKDKDTYMLRLDGSAVNEDYSFDIATEEDIVKWSKDTLNKDFRNYEVLTSLALGCSNFTKDWVIKNMNSIIENIDIDTIPKVPLNVLDGMVIVKLKEGSFNIQVVSDVVFLGPNQYKVVIMDLPLMDKKITIDTLRMLNISNAREPRINRRLNPTIDPELIKANRRLVRRLR